jgi:hypothetical protein
MEMVRSETIISNPNIITNGTTTHINITIAINDSSKSFIIFPP